MTDEKSCYTCSKLLGTIKNSYGKVVAICMEHRIRDAPPASIGCDRHVLRRDKVDDGQD